MWEIKKKEWGEKLTISENENFNNNHTIESEIKNCKMKKIPILGNYNKKLSKICKIRQNLKI